MVAAGYVNDDQTTIVTGPDEGTTTTGAVAEAPTAIRGKEWSGTDDVINHPC
jgi:hypothetical protein